MVPTFDLHPITVVLLIIVGIIFGAIAIVIDRTAPAPVSPKMQEQRPRLSLSWTFWEWDEFPPGLRDLASPRYAHARVLLKRSLLTLALVALSVLYLWGLRPHDGGDILAILYGSVAALLITQLHRAG
jgi:hypothetical protein